MRTERNTQIEIPKLGSICMLCQKKPPIKNSHLFPKFVGRWLKDTGTAYFRAATTPNRREEDTTRLPMLCSDCESLFSGWESKFAERVFRPFQEDKSSFLKFDYSNWFANFVISISWRVLAATIDGLEEREPTAYVPVANAFEEWRLYLLGISNRIRPYHHQLFFFTSLTDKPNDLKLPSRYHSYLLRSVDGTLVYSGHKVYVYSLLAGICIWSPISPPIATGWPKGSHVFEKGCFKVGQHVQDPVWGPWTIKRAEEAFSLPLSAKQQTKVNESFEKLLREKQPEDVERALEAMLYDWRWRQ
ncbi:MAG: hypothetical protein EKK48_29945 [Candidatus Melainabacteria bacterium]|nr:MAG: hypothetical protein EKK48_29945 [Candidatus Melainabacteria bacterium]